MASTKYTYKHLQEIYDIFGDEDFYTEIRNFLYIDVPVEVADEIRNVILNLIEHPLEKRTNLESETLDLSLSSFITNSVSVKDEQKVESKKADNYVKATKNLLDIISSFSEEFKFDSTSTKHAAPVLAGDSMPFKRLVAYRALARKKLAAIEDREHSFTIQEQRAIHIVFKDEIKVKKGQDQKVKIDGLADSYSWETIYTELSNAYEDACKEPFVTTTLKTNHLKTSGIHTKNVITGLIIAAGVSFALGFAPIAGAPTVNPSMEAIMNFVSTQVLPVAGLGLATGIASTTGFALADNRSMQQLRNQIKILDQPKKEMLFDKIQKYAKARETAKNARDDNGKKKRYDQKTELKKLQKELADEGIHLEWGSRKQAKFAHLLDTEDAITAQLAATSSVGATKRHLRKKAKTEAKIKSLAPKNSEFTEQAKSKMAEILSAKNPACKFLDIKGTKNATRTRRTKTENPRVPVTSFVTTPSISPSVAYAKEESTETVISPTNEDRKLIKNSLKSANVKVRTIKAKIKESDTEFSTISITIAKSRAGDFSSKFNSIMENLSEYIRSGDVEPTELEYTSGIGKASNTLTVSIKKEKPTKK